jgi:hypothetical protein
MDDEPRAWLDDHKMHSFIIKLWLDDTIGESGDKPWHGYITHAPSGTRRYLGTLDDILSFIHSYLGSDQKTPRQISHKPKPAWRLTQWLRLRWTKRKN